MIMDRENNIFFERILSSHPSLPLVISFSIGSLTAKKIDKVLQSYEQPNQFLIGAFLNKSLIAVAGFERIHATGIIRHMSVLNNFRNRGVGKQLLQHVIKYFKLCEVKAETDKESIGFYKSLGFTCTPFENQYGIRYACAIQCSSETERNKVR